MPEYDNRNRGVLFNNTENKKSPKHPDYKGSLDVGGVDFEIAGWVQTSTKTGKKFMSLSIKPKQERG